MYPTETANVGDDATFDTYAKQTGGVTFLNKSLAPVGGVTVGETAQSAGMLREAMPEYVYVNGIRKKFIELKNGERFSENKSKNSEKYIFVSGREYAILNSEINEANRTIHKLGMPPPNYGIIDIGERYLYEYVIKDDTPFVLKRIPWTEENAQFATEWREYVDEQIKAYESTRAVSWDIDTFRRRLADYFNHDDTAATERATGHITRMGQKVVGYVWGATSSGKIPDSKGRDSQAHSDALIQEEFNFIEDVGATVFDNWVQTDFLGMLREEKNPEILTRLNNGETVKAYRAMLLHEGKLYPPMAGIVDGKPQPHAEFNKWLVSEERPDLAKPKWDKKRGDWVRDKETGETAYYFNLKKLEKGLTDVPARYNPYWHTSLSPLNDQFSSAYKRPGIVVVEVEVPASELTSGYRAEKAKNAVGKTEWHSGPVSSKLKKVGKPREVILSRWCKIKRIVPDSEVADSIAETLRATDIAVPVNVVTPSLLKELEKNGVAIERGSTFGSLREGLDAHLQARREAMPKMGLEAARANVQAALHREAGESRKAWAKRKTKAVATFVAEKMVDARLPVIHAMNDITGGEKQDERTDIPLAMQTSYGRVFSEHLKIDQDFVNPTLKTLSDNGLDVETLDTYLMAMFAPERNKMILERTKYGRFKGNVAGSGITDEKAAQLLDELKNRLTPKQWDALERAAARVWELNRDNLDRLVDFGVMSEKQAETWKTLSPHYVPLRDDFEAMGIALPYGTSMAGQNYIKAVGRFSEANTSHFGWSILQAKQGVMWAEQNYINNIALNFCMDNASEGDYRVAKMSLMVKKVLREEKGFREEDAVPLRMSVDVEREAIEAFREGGYTIVQDPKDADIFWVDSSEFDKVLRVKKTVDGLRTAMRHNVVVKVGGFWEAPRVWRIDANDTMQESADFLHAR